MFLPSFPKNIEHAITAKHGDCAVAFLAGGGWLKASETTYEIVTA